MRKTKRSEMGITVFGDRMWLVQTEAAGISQKIFSDPGKNLRNPSGRDP
jgi:hypothetical protein